MAAHAEECLYCGMLLSPGHEHDHFPTPLRRGGTEMVCVCANCHSLKDRVPLDRWNAGHAMRAFAGLWAKAEPLERIALAKMLALFEDAKEEIRGRQ